jgi:hypothetical protein
MRDPDEDAMKQVAGVCPARIRQCHVRAVSGSAYDCTNYERASCYGVTRPGSSHEQAEQSISGLVVRATSTCQTANGSV